MPETIIPIVTNTQQYYSASKGTHLPLHEMEQHHLDNAIKKLQREQENGSPVAINVLNGLLAEQQKRKAANPNTQPATQAEQPAQPAVEITADPVFEGVNYGVLAASLAAVTQRLTSGTLQQTLDPARIKQLVDAINAAVVNSGGATGEAQFTVAVISGSTPLAALANAQYPELTSKLLLNSLSGYGITTVGQLARLSYCDFGALRFSTATAFIEALDLVAKAGLTWGTTSSILIFDGYINRILNPNASEIDVFVGEATARLNKAVGGLHGASSTLSSVQSIERIFNGIKRRLSLAASVLGTALLARGRTAATAVPALGTMPQLSTPFRNQVKHYLTRVEQRVARIERDALEDATHPLFQA